MSQSKIVTRFAPSPTGFLHIGNARTALFNWLFARHTGGHFLLRIEDTDRARSTQPAIDVILKGLEWLGLDWDGEVVYQFSRAKRHSEVAYDLLNQGKAYQSFETQEEIEAKRSTAWDAGIKPVYAGRDETPHLKDPRPFVIRLKAPLEGETVNPDLIQGDVRIANSQLDDMVLLRSDGTPTYMLAVVVDDHDMGVTHVIRGDDHLTNAARQIQLFQAIGWTPPLFGHMALIHGADGQKLSKRHGALGIDWYEKTGYLPEAMVNYLARLGWSHGDDELFTRQQAVSWFDIKDINKAPSRLDFDKLDFVNGHYLKQLSAPETIQKLCAYRCLNSLSALTETQKQILLPLIPVYQERAKTLNALNQELSFLLNAELPSYDESGQSLITIENKDRIARFAQQLSCLSSWTAPEIDSFLKEFLKTEGVKMPMVGPVIRLAVTGKPQAPSIGLILEALQHKTTIERLQAFAN